MKRVFTYYMIALALIAISVSGVLVESCRTAKVVSSSLVITAKRDSVQLDSNSIIFKATVKDMEYYSKVDTSVGVAGSWVELVEAFDGPFDAAQGDRQGVDTILKNGNATLTTYTNSKGQRKTRCECDSITLVLKNREIYIHYKESSYDSLLFLYRLTHTRSDSTTLKDVVKVETQGWLQGLKSNLNFILVLLGGMVAAWVGYRAYQFFKNIA